MSRCVSALCPRPGLSGMAGLWLCDEHLAEVERLVAAKIGQDVALGRVDAVVYYLGDYDTRQVKIGTTTALRHRVRELKARRPAAELLAAEPGHFLLESARHAQFVHLRINPRREWFARGDDLIHHVNCLRARYGLWLSEGAQK